MPEPVKLSAAGASDFADDGEIAKRIDALIGEGETDKEIATQLATEFEGDISDLIAAARSNAAEKVGISKMKWRLRTSTKTPLATKRWTWLMRWLLLRKTATDSGWRTTA